MTVKCQCGQPVVDAYVCQTCTRRLAADLADVPWLIEQLDIALARQTVIGGHGAGHTEPEPYEPDAVPGATRRALPYDPRASEAAWILRTTLATWHETFTANMPTAGHTKTPGVGKHPTPTPATPHVPVQRCPTTDLPTDSCAHCRKP